MTQLTRELLEFARQLYESGESPEAGLKALRDLVASKQQAQAAESRQLKSLDSTRTV